MVEYYTRTIDFQALDLRRSDVRSSVCREATDQGIRGILRREGIDRGIRQILHREDLGRREVLCRREDIDLGFRDIVRQRGRVRDCEDVSR